MRYYGILALPCAVLRYSYPPYAPLETVEWEIPEKLRRSKNQEQILTPRASGSHLSAAIYAA